jgi:predicted MFS family arabinose efflux permease
MNKFNGLWVLYAGTIVQLFGGGMIIAYLARYAQDLGGSIAVAGAVVAASALGRSALAIPVGILSDKIGRKTPMVLGLTLTCIGSLLCGLAQNPTHLFLSRMIWGLGVPIYSVSAYALMADIFSESERTKPIGFFQTAQKTASMFGAFAGGIAAGALGYRVPPLCLSIVAFIMVIGTIKFCRIPNLKPSSSVVTFREALSSRPLLAINALIFLLFLTSFGLTYSIIPLFSEVKGIGEAGNGALIGMRGVGTIIGTFSSIYLASFMGKRYLILGGFLTSSIVVYLFVYSGGFLSLLALMFGFGFATGIVMPLLITSAVNYAPVQARGGVMGVTRLADGLGGTFGPILLTSLVGWGDYRSAFLTASLILLIAFLVALIPKNEKKKKEHLGQTSD